MFPFSVVKRTHPTRILFEIKLVAQLHHALILLVEYSLFVLLLIVLSFSKNESLNKDKKIRGHKFQVLEGRYGSLLLQQYQFHYKKSYLDA